MDSCPHWRGRGQLWRKKKVKEHLLITYCLPASVPSHYPGHTLVRVSLLALKSAAPLLLASCPSPLPTFPSLPTTKLSCDRLWMDPNPGSLSAPLGRWLSPWAWVSASVRQMATLWTRITWSDVCTALSPQAGPWPPEVSLLLDPIVMAVISVEPTLGARHHIRLGMDTNYLWGTYCLSFNPCWKGLRFFYKWESWGFGKESAARRAGPGFHLDEFNSKDSSFLSSIVVLPSCQWAFNTLTPSSLP